MHLLYFLPRQIYSSSLNELQVLHTNSQKYNVEPHLALSVILSATDSTFEASLHLILQTLCALFNIEMLRKHYVVRETDMKGKNNSEASFTRAVNFNTMQQKAKNNQVRVVSAR